MTTFTRSPSKIDQRAPSSPSPVHRLLRLMRQFGDTTKLNNVTSQVSTRGFLRGIFSVTNLLILSWLCTIWWGERLSFRKSLAACQWHEWEQWPPGARPHHVVLIADPQLVDPHTYPGRPWPLSHLTMSYTDMYLRRSYQSMQQFLQPDTVFFLGDLFDGGREWSTEHSTSPDRQYKKYNNDYWMKEYVRFERLFIDSWLESAPRSSAEPRGKRIIASLPGNHDLGFASGIQMPVKRRFETYFGTGNRVDVIGNHSFISVDTVSLSAMDQVDPKTGSSGAGDGTSPSAANRNIWGPTEDFLSDLRHVRERALKRELRFLADLPEQDRHDAGLSGYSPESIDLAAASKSAEATGLNFDDVEKSFPSILLTHVPLYRDPDIDCGPRRERGSAIAVQSGYQYQNVLTPLISKDIVTRVGAVNIAQVYSGDDHDYCEIEHGEFTGKIKEITVKSMSLAMGIRKPGFLAVSLHNPVEVEAYPRTNEPDQGEATTKRDTIQNHLCLLPDQLAILVRYSMLAALTLVVLFVKAIAFPVQSARDDAKPLLPIRQDKQAPYHVNATVASTLGSSSSSSSTSPDQAVSGRHANTPVLPSQRLARSDCLANGRRVQGGSTLATYGNLPVSSRSSSPSKSRLDKAPDQDRITSSVASPAGAAFAPARGASVISSVVDAKRRGWIGPRAAGRYVVVTVMMDFARVAVPVLLFYAWLVSRW